MFEKVKRAYVVVEVTFEDGPVGRHSLLADVRADGTVALDEALARLRWQEMERRHARERQALERTG